jgi:hypothetical protein
MRKENQGNAAHTEMNRGEKKEKKGEQGKTFPPFSP